jgi:hypothetical protein
MTFKRSLFGGYNRRAVDQFVAEHEAIHGRHLQQQALHAQYVAEQAAARRALEAEIESLRAAEPMLKVNQEVGTLLTSFASTVATLRERAEREAGQTRAVADDYALHRREEADRWLDEQRERAGTLARQAVRAARTEIVNLAHNQAAVEQSLRDLAAGVYSWLTSLERLRLTMEFPADLGEFATERESGVAPAEGPGPPQLPPPVEPDPERETIVDFRPASEFPDGHDEHE